MLPYLTAWRLLDRVVLRLSLADLPCMRREASRLRLSPGTSPLPSAFCHPPCSLWDTYSQSWMGGYNFYPNRHSGGYHCHGSGATRKCYYPREVAWEWASTPFVNAQNCGPGCITSSDIPLDVAGERQEGLGMVGITDRVKTVVEEWAVRLKNGHAG